MGTPILSRRPVRAWVAIAGLAAVAIGCNPEVVGPGTPEEGPLRIRTVLAGSMDPSLFDLDSVAVVIRRAADGATVRETVLPYEPDAVLAWVLSLDDLPDVLDVEVEVRSGQTPMFAGLLEGVDVEEASPATPGPVYDVLLHYVGPGYDAAAVTVVPGDAVVLFGETVTFEAVVTNAAGDVIPNAIVFWESSDPGVAPVDELGSLTAPSARGGVEVTARAANGVSGSTDVRFQPFVGELLVVEGDGVTADVATSVTVTVRVVGTDGLGVEDVDVAFAAPEGAQVAAPFATSDADGRASTVVTLGTLPGPYVFTAEVAGPAAVEVTIDAEPGPPAALQVDLEGSTAAPAEIIAPGVTVTVVDAYGNVTDDALDVALALGANPVGAMLAGTILVGASGGVATFTDLVIDRHGSGFTLVASAGGVADGVSIPFDVVQIARSVEVTPGEHDLLALGATATFVAVALDGAGTPIEGQALVWTSADEDVATVDGTGTVSAVGNGSVVIRASAGDASGTATVDVTQAPARIVVTPAESELSALGDQTQLAAVVVDANGFPVEGFTETPTWTSSSGAVAVDAAGLATAEANGTADVEAITTAGVSGSATVTVRQVVASIVVSPTSAELVSLDEQVQLTAEALDANGFAMGDGDFVWSSDGETVASVDAAGLVTAVANGGTTILVSTEGVSGSAAVAVAQAVASLEIDPATSELTALQDEVQLEAAAYDANGHPVAGAVLAWSSSDDAVASVSVTGLVTAESNGPATITASAGGLEADADVVVAQEAAAVVVSPEDVTLVSIDETAALSALVVDANGFPLPDQSVSWTSSTEGAVTVDGAGTVTAVTHGTSMVTASAGLVSGAAEVTVSQRVATIDLSVSCYDATPPAPSSGGPLLVASIEPQCDTLAAFGDQALVTAEARDANGYGIASPPITWTSLAPEFAPVDDMGVVTAIDNGTAVIRAEADGVVAEVEIVVRQVVVWLSVEPAELTLQVGDVALLTATPEDANGFLVADAEVGWHSLDQTKVSVDDSGIVAALASCETKVYATHGDFSDYAVITVE